ncbi:MAG: hypothetical protein CSA33_02885 [Desulfobulbus propionicus]|nr:MAG: hypothetical protein CSA33_02885 [Desulfobulbus propionicus]
MKIVQSSFLLSSTHHQEIQTQERETLEIRSGAQGARAEHPPESNAQAGDTVMQALQDTVALSEVAQKGRQQLVSLPELGDIEPVDELNIRLLKALMETILGVEFSLRSPQEVVTQTGAGTGQNPSVPIAEQGSEEGDDWGMLYQYSYSYYEAEKTAFQARGTVQTGDGQEIDIDLSLQMSREFFESAEVQVEAGQVLKDPLVVHFSGTAAELTQRSFFFDIDADGQEDQIAFVKPGSGFLALDRNGDGVVNDGSELFGALTGNGFAELAAYDQDGNAWIDEQDAIYDRLQIWTKDSAGHDQLTALGAQGIGAVYLGNVATPFSLKDETNVLQGEIRSTGLFLRENGTAGTIQQVDLVA